MNYIWGGMILISLVYGYFNGNLDAVVEAGFSGARDAVETVLSFAGIMCLWTGILKAAEKSGISRVVKKLLSPLVRLLFPKLKKDSEAAEFITLNITANLLGMGNGATPMGIKAMNALDDHSGRVTDEMCMFMVLNTAAFQLIPSTVIAFRSAAGSIDPFSVIIPIWITSLVSLTAGVVSVKIMCMLSRRKRGGG